MLQLTWIIVSRLINHIFCEGEGWLSLSWTWQPHHGEVSWKCISSTQVKMMFLPNLIWKLVENELQQQQHRVNFALKLRCTLYFQRGSNDSVDWISVQKCISKYTYTTYNTFVSGHFIHFDWLCILAIYMDTNLLKASMHQHQCYFVIDLIRIKSSCKWRSIVYRLKLASLLFAWYFFPSLVSCEGGWWEDNFASK